MNDFFLKTEKEKEDSQKAAEEVGSKKEATIELKDVSKSILNANQTDSRLLKSAKILERMVNLNTFDDIAKKYKKVV